jgi:hypothetical protein
MRIGCARVRVHAVVCATLQLCVFARRSFRRRACRTRRDRFVAVLGESHTTLICDTADLASIERAVPQHLACVPSELLFVPFAVRF